MRCARKTKAEAAKCEAREKQTLWPYYADGAYRDAIPNLPKEKKKRVSRNLETRLHKLVGLTGFEPATP